MTRRSTRATPSTPRSSPHQGNDSLSYPRIAAEALTRSGKYGTPQMKHLTDGTPARALRRRRLQGDGAGGTERGARAPRVLVPRWSSIVDRLIARRLAGPVAGPDRSDFLTADLDRVHRQQRAVPERAGGGIDPLRRRARNALALGSGRRLGRAVPGLFLGATTLTRPETSCSRVIRALRHPRPRCTPPASACAPPCSSWPPTRSSSRPYRAQPDRPGPLRPATTGGGKALFVATNLPARGPAPDQRKPIERFTCKPR